MILGSALIGCDSVFASGLHTPAKQHAGNRTGFMPVTIRSQLRSGCTPRRLSVGSPEIVAERLQEYAALGIDSFILSGYPHLEEAYRFAELVFPLLDRAPQEASPELRLI